MRFTLQRVKHCTFCSINLFL